MAPLPSELLEKPIRPDLCPVTIVEWRPTSNIRRLTTPNAKAEKAISLVCRGIMNAFPAFLTKESINIKLRGNPKGIFSMMPWDIDNGGLAYRNLNDMVYRFRDRTKFYDEAGRLLSVSGYTDRITGTTYMRNDIFLNDGTINKEFMITFAHELFHVLSNYYGVYDSLGHHRDDIDEKLAVRFTEFLGLGK